MSDLIKCVECGRQTNKYSPSCEYCSAPLERGDPEPSDASGGKDATSVNSAAQTIEEHGKTLHADLGKYSSRLEKCPSDDVRKHNNIFFTFLAGMGALFIIMLIFMGTANFLKGFTAIKYNNKLSPALKSDPAKADYVKKYISVTDFGTLDETDPDSPTVTKYFYGTIKNGGDKTVIKLTLTVYYFDKKSLCIAEGTISPILGTRGKPNSVSPGSSKDFKLPIMDTIPGWSGRIREKVSDIEFL